MDEEEAKQLFDAAVYSITGNVGAYAARLAEGKLDDALNEFAKAERAFHDSVPFGAPSGRGAFARMCDRVCDGPTRPDRLYRFIMHSSGQWDPHQQHPQPSQWRVRLYGTVRYIVRYRTHTTLVI